MISENQELVQLLNTAIIKSKEKEISSSYEERLTNTCQTPAIRALTVAITTLAESEKITKDQAAIQIIETVRDLDNIWDDYVMMEGLGKLKEQLQNGSSLN